MGVANTKSTAITNADTVGGTINGSYLAKGMLLEAVGLVEIAAADDDGSVYRFARVPSNARITSITRLNDAITAATVYDLGVYQTAANGGAVVSANVFANDVDINAGTVTPVEHYNTTLNVDKSEKRLWEVLGLSADPKIDYDICWTGATVGTAAGTLVMKVKYVV